MSQGMEFQLKKSQSRKERLMMDILTIILFIIIVILLVKMLGNIELLKTDPCAYCMEKTGAYCFRW